MTAEPRPTADEDLLGELINCRGATWKQRETLTVRLAELDAQIEEVRAKLELKFGSPYTRSRIGAA